MPRWRRKTTSSVCLVESEELPDASRKNGTMRESPTVKPTKTRKVKLSRTRSRRRYRTAKKSRLPRRVTRRDAAEVDRPELRRNPVAVVNRKPKSRA